MRPMFVPVLLLLLVLSVLMLVLLLLFALLVLPPASHRANGSRRYSQREMARPDDLRFERGDERPPSLALRVAAAIVAIVAAGIARIPLLAFLPLLRRRLTSQPRLSLLVEHLAVSSTQHDIVVFKRVELLLLLCDARLKLVPRLRATRGLPILDLLRNRLPAILTGRSTGTSRWQEHGPGATLAFATCVGKTERTISSRSTGAHDGRGSIHTARTHGLGRL